MRRFQNACQYWLDSKTITPWPVVSQIVQHASVEGSLELVVGANPDQVLTSTRVGKLGVGRAQSSLDLVHRILLQQLLRMLQAFAVRARAARLLAPAKWGMARGQGKPWP